MPEPSPRRAVLRYLRDALLLPAFGLALTVASAVLMRVLQPENPARRLLWLAPALLLALGLAPYGRLGLRALGDLCRGEADTRTVEITRVTRDRRAVPPFPGVRRDRGWLLHTPDGDYLLRPEKRGRKPLPAGRTVLRCARRSRIVTGWQAARF